MDYQLTQYDIEWCKAHADVYRSKQYNPLPSAYSGDRKKPLCRFKEYWDQPAPAELFDRFVTGSIQLVCGRRWRLLVIDLDGEEAFDEFDRWGAVPRTWISHSPGGGAHIWFAVERHGSELKKGFLWESDERKAVREQNLGLPEGQKLELPHQAIERICDHSLIMVPPSIHPKSGGRYEFDGYNSPRGIQRPALAPGWLLAMPLLPPPVKQPIVPVERPREAPRRSEPYRDWKDEIREIPNKMDLVRRWGLRFARGGTGGWLACHAIDREDVVASAQFHPESGIYNEPGQSLTLSLPQLGVRLGIYSDWKAALDDLRSTL